MFLSLTTILGEPANVSYEIQGYKTGYSSIDQSIGGISGSDLVLIASKKGNCGNLLMLNLGVGLSKRYHVLIITPIKSPFAVAKDLRSVLLPCDGQRVNDDELLNELNNLAINIFIENNVHFLEEIDNAIARFHSEYPDDSIILIDQLNSIFLSKEIRTYSRSQEEREISVNLKMLTLKYNTPILLLASVKSPEPDHEKDPPAFEDLDHLIGLTCPFNKIIGIHRPEYYLIELDEKGISTEGKLFLNVLRNENGIRGYIRLNFDKSNRFLLTDETHIQFD
ncbi:MAG: DnaB-like helicase C-terminal domain-containing protein [bacterium]